METSSENAELARLDALRRYGILDTTADQSFDDIALLASHICRTKIALISFVDENRQWFKSSVGLGVTETSRELSFCAHAIRQPELFVVTDATSDERFAANPLVTSEPNIRFYAGMPLRTEDGHALGTLCVIDSAPRELNQAQVEALTALSRQVMTQLELHRNAGKIKKINEELCQEVAEHTRAEERLRESQARYQRIAANAPGMLYQFRMSPDGSLSFPFVSDGCRDIYGVEPHKIMADAWIVLDLIHPADRNSFQSSVAESARTLEPWKWEGRSLLPSGEVKWVQCASRPERQTDGSIVWDGLVMDLTPHKAVEERLRESEARYRVVAESASDAIITADETSTILFANPAAERIFGYRVEELVGNKLFVLMPEALRGAHAHGMKRYAETGRRHIPWHAVQVPARHKDGHEVQVEIAFGEYLRDGKRLFTAVIRDITERKRAEEAIRKSEEYSNLFRLANDAILIFEPEEETVLDVNDRACEVYGLAREEFVGRSLKTMSKDAARGERQLDELLTAGTYQEFETVQFRGDGTPIHLLINSSVIEYEGRRAVLSINRDVTERERAKERLRRSEEWMRAIFDASRDGIIVEDDEHIVYVNRSYARMFGYDDPEELAGRHVSTVMCAEDEERMLEFGRRRARGEQPPSVYEFKGRRRDGTRIDLEASVSTPTIGGKTYITTAIRDITERKRAAEALRQGAEALRQSEEQLRQAQKMEAVGQLAGGVAHDFNNLLSVITGNTQLALRKQSAATPLTRRLEEIEKASERAAALTRQLLAFSRRQQLERKHIRLDDLVADVMKMLQRIIGEDITVHVSSAGHLPFVCADPGQVEQVVMNLAVNARDAMPDGGDLFIETHAVSLDDEYCARHAYAKPGRYVRLMVSDTGTGMGKETQARIFEPFFTTKEVGKGTGLGLAMVYGIVKQHDGFIEVYSEPGHGTTFKIYLSVVAEKSTEEEEQEHAEVIGGTETILLAEDEDALRQLTRDVLEELGYMVLTARDGAEAVEIYRAGGARIDLVMLDVVMPRMGGREACERIREMDAEVPFVFMSGYSNEMYGDRHAGDGAEGVVTIQKPYKLETLGERVRNALDAVKNSPR